MSEAWRTRVVVARIDPGQIQLSLVPAFAGNQQWTIARVAGQFRGSLPFGWVVSRGRELLQNGSVPLPLQQANRGVDLDHRDARLALGTQADGRVIIALTRFYAFGRSLGRFPLGLTTPEMAAVMGALGARDALLLDGGISAQLLIRNSSGVGRRWPGIRSVPLGLIGRPRSQR